MADAPLRMCPPPPPTPPCSQVVGGKPLELDCIPHFDVEDVSGAHPWDAGLASKPVDRVCGKQKRRAQFDVGRRARQRGRVSVCRTVIEGRAMTCGKKRVPGMGRDARHHGGELRGNSGDGAGAREGVQGGPHTRATPPSTSHPPPPPRVSPPAAHMSWPPWCRRRRPGGGPGPGQQWGRAWWPLRQLCWLHGGLQLCNCGMCSARKQSLTGGSQTGSRAALPARSVGPMNSAHVKIEAQRLRVLPNRGLCAAVQRSHSSRSGGASPAARQPLHSIRA